jgi:hypothetical protein
METRAIDYRIRYDDRTVLVMPFSESLAVGDTWKDSVAQWRVVRMGAPVPEEPVDVWVEPVRE